jgi:hypothetical protein
MDRNESAYGSQGWTGLLGTGDFSRQDSEDPLTQLRDILHRGIPEDLPVQVELGMHDPVADRDDLPPGNLRVTLP